MSKRRLAVGPTSSRAAPFLGTAPDTTAEAQIGSRKLRHAPLDPRLPIGESGTELTPDISALQIDLGLQLRRQRQRRNLGHREHRRPQRSAGSAVGEPEFALQRDRKLRYGAQTETQAGLGFAIGDQRAAGTQEQEWIAGAARAEAVATNGSGLAAPIAG